MWSKRVYFFATVCVMVGIFVTLWMIVETAEISKKQERLVEVDNISLVEIEEARELIKKNYKAGALLLKVLTYEIKNQCGKR